MARLYRQFALQSPHGFHRGEAMNRILTALKVRPGEERLAALLGALMLFTAAGGALGGNATEALFFARFGVALLPYMYVALGLFTFATSLGLTALMGRLQRERLYTALPFVLGFTLIAERLILPFNLKWFFAVIWLVMNVIGNLQGLLTWGLAGAACDTRQAKRLFPLFSAGGILGTVLGGLLTQPLARWLHSENLLLVWAGALFVSFVLGRALVGRSAAPLVQSSRKPPSILKEMARGYRFVRQSPILQWVSYSAILFSVCYFSLALPFSRGATAQFPNADELAGFLGLFQSLNTGAALLASLFLANRLFARFGILPMLLLFPLIYLAGFGVLAFYAPFAILVAVRFAQMAWMQGIAGTAWQALFNVVPAEERDQVRTFVGGVPEQAGTFIAGLILVVGEQALRPQQLYFVGLAAAALTVYVIWRASRAYSRALVDALRAGQPHMFFSEDEPFGGFRQDAGAVAAAVAGMGNADPVIRRVSAEILGNLAVPEATTALVNSLVDADTTVRVAALRGLARARATPALLEIAASLGDAESDVRLCAVEALRLLAGYPRGLSAHIAPLLNDSEPVVRARAALTLLQIEQHAAARHTLRAMAGDPDPLVRVSAIEALGECAERDSFEMVATSLSDSQPAVRKAAARALAQIDSARALDTLIHALNDDDQSVRAALAAALGQIGEAALAPVAAALENPSYEDGALLALEHLPAHKAAPALRAHAQRTVQTALGYHELAVGLGQVFGRTPQPGGDGRQQLLIESLHDKGHRAGLNALRAVGLLGDHEAIAVAVENLRSRDPAQRANALETLESISARELVRPLLALWESGNSAPEPPADWLMQLLSDDYAWLRACAALAAAGTPDPALRARLQTLADIDPDPIVRATAARALNGEHVMDTLATLSLMERILLLRRVPLFSELPPADLKQVAAITSESVFADGEALARQGEAGSEMFIVVSGEVKVIVKYEDEPAEQEIARRARGDYVGEMAIISQEPRMASLVADGPVRALCIAQKQFEGILRERPETGLALMRVLCQRLREMRSPAPAAAR
jgi:HEAT repeat protein